ncbi:hypothetical protein NHX12_012132 [Muraenolepis orangiensis]|uniref:Uncharacterized protein n=1 Tax=Muraenolepis orangiensis TaxID=630683 RepID=A0A9Q0DH48_9TELE|nr:hypothetical protein NHX12_012132 [Muraenolepis orangiensis]
MEHCGCNKKRVIVYDNMSVDERYETLGRPEDLSSEARGPLVRGQRTSRQRPEDLSSEARGPLVRGQRTSRLLQQDTFNYEGVTLVKRSESQYRSARSFCHRLYLWYIFAEKGKALTPDPNPHHSDTRPVFFSTNMPNNKS